MRTILTLILVSLVLSFTSASAYQASSANKLTDPTGSYENSNYHFSMGVNNGAIKDESKINGKWIGKVSGPQGDFELTFNFKVEGDSLKGTNSSSMGESELTNGVVKGNDFSFDIDVQGMTITHKCKYLDDDTIEVKVVINDQEMVMKLTRATE